MTFNFKTFSTKLKATFDIMEKYGEGSYEQEKFCTRNQKLESASTFYRSNNNGNYLAATN